MAWDNSVTVVGNLVRDVELRWTPSGKAVANFGVAVNQGRGDDEKVSFFDVTAWDKLGENAAESLVKGQRVVVFGRLEQRSWEDQKTGDKRSKIEIVADDVAPSLKWATASVERNERDSGGRSGGKSGGRNAAPSRSFEDEEPF